MDPLAQKPDSAVFLFYQGAQVEHLWFIIGFMQAFDVSWILQLDFHSEHHLELVSEFRGFYCRKSNGGKMTSWFSMCKHRIAQQDVELQHMGTYRSRHPTVSQEFPTKFSSQSCILCISVENVILRSKSKCSVCNYINRRLDKTADLRRNSKEVSTVRVTRWRIYQEDYL